MTPAPSLLSGSGTIVIEDDANVMPYVYALAANHLYGPLSSYTFVVTHSTTLFCCRFTFQFLEITPLRTVYMGKEPGRTISALTRILFSTVELALCSVSGNKRAGSIMICGKAKPALPAHRYQEISRMRMWLTLYTCISSNMCLILFIYTCTT